MRLDGPLWIDLADDADRDAWNLAIPLMQRPDAGLPFSWVPDTLEHPVLALSPSVTDAPHVRFAADLAFGPDGAGRLSLFDTRVRPLSPEAQRRLHDLGAIAAGCLGLIEAAREAQAQAQAQEGLFRLLAETSTDTIVRGDLNGVRLYVSPSVRELLGYEPEELLGRKALELTHPDDAPTFQSLMRDVRDGRIEVATSEQRQLHKNGSWVWMEASIRMTRDRTTGEPDGYVASVRGIGRRKELEDRLAHLASYDELTGLPNRAMFGRHLLAAVEGARNVGRSLALFYMDIDGFKQVNDSLGHQAGDAVLREAAARLHSVLRSQDLVARLGGDEFTAILEVSRSEAASLSRRLTASLAQPFRYEGADISIGLSIGIAFMPEDATHPDKLLSCADKALYAAKAAGGGAFRFFEERTPSA